MSNKNKNERVQTYLIVAATFFMLAGLLAVLAIPKTTLAAKPDKPPGQDGLVYTVALEFDPEAPEHEDIILSGGFNAPTYLPECVAKTHEDTYIAVFERHNLCATVTTSTGYTLTDDIGLHVGTNKAGNIISFQLIGQDVIGREGLIHKSEIVTIDPPIIPSTEGFTLHVDTDNIEVWKYDKHLNTGGAKPVEMVGYISIGDLVYTPVSQ
jgi:hypothetical protein